MLQRVDERENAVARNKDDGRGVPPVRVVNLFEVLSGQHEVYLVLEFLSGGELYDLVKERGKLEEDCARLYFQQICQGEILPLERRVPQRLETGEYILRSREKTCKVGDFGLAAQK